MQILAQSALFVALTSFAFGFATLAKNVRNKLYILFAIGCTLLSAWALFFFLSRLYPEKGYYGWHLSLNAWVTPAALAFIQYMMRIERWRTSRILFWSSLGLCVLMSVALLLGWERYIAIKKIIYFTPSLLLLQVVLMMVYDKRIETTFGIVRRFPLYIGAGILLLTCTMDHIPGLWLGIPVFGNIALTIYLFFLGQALLQQKLLNFTTLASRFLVTTLIAFLLTCVYSLVAVWASDDFALYFLNSLFVSFLMLMLLEPIRSLVVFVTGKIIAEKHHRLQVRVRNARHELAQTFDPRAALVELEKFLHATLAPRALAIFLRSPDQTRFRRDSASGAEGHFDRAVNEIPRQHPLIELSTKMMKRGDLPIVLDQLILSEMERTAGKTLKVQYEAVLEAMAELKGGLFIPFFSEGNMLGFAVLDVDQPPEEWGTNWALLRDIYPIVELASKTLSQLEVFVRQREIERLATLGEMAAGLAHEIRNPLGAIKGAAQYLDPSQNRPESRFLSVILEEVERLNRVVTRFLDYSKPSAPERKELDLNVLAQRVVALLSNTVPPGMDLRFQSSLLEAPVRGSSEQLHQVLLNLVQNAFKALARAKKDAGQVIVSIDLERGTPGSAPRVKLSVEDNGPGIPRENQDKIFIPFFTTDPSGTGLGLSICQKIVEAHQGRIAVFSEPGLGTKLTVELPLLLRPQLRSVATR